MSGDAQVSTSPIVISGLQYLITISDNNLTIGCQQHTPLQWAEFTDDQIYDMDGKRAAEFWMTHKASILALAYSHITQDAPQ